MLNYFIEIIKLLDEINYLSLNRFAYFIILYIKIFYHLIYLFYHSIYLIIFSRIFEFIHLNVRIIMVVIDLIIFIIE